VIDMGREIMNGYGQKQIEKITNFRSTIGTVRNILTDFKGVLVEKIKQGGYELDGAMKVVYNYSEEHKEEILLQMYYANGSSNSIKSYLGVATGKGNSTEEAYDDLLAELKKINYS
jgi:hypothetical protein